MANDKRKRALKRGLTPLAAVALLTALVVSAGGTLAWLTTRTEAITNTFTPAQVECKINETFTDGIKRNVYVSNPNSPENVPAYIRVALIPTWEDGEGNVVAQPASLADLEIQWDSTNWIKGGDGYYYCKAAIAPGQSTPVLIQTATVKTTNGYRMNLHVLADAIQAEPVSAVTETWKVELDTDGHITGQGGGGL